MLNTVCLFFLVFIFLSTRPARALVADESAPNDLSDCIFVVNIEGEFCDNGPCILHVMLGEAERTSCNALKATLPWCKR